MSETFWINDKDLDMEQGRAVQNIGLDESFLIRGPAGSGKTNILLLRAKRLVLKKLSNIKVVVFTSSLRDFMHMGCTQYGIPPEIVITGVRLFRDLLDEYGVSYTLTKDFGLDRDLLAGEVKALIEAHGISNIFDSLLIDEAQDYTDTELWVLRRLTKRLVLAADTRQSIYKVTHTPGLLEKLTSDKSVNLKYHYRSGLHICMVADSILKDSKNFPSIAGESKYDEKLRPSSVVLVRCANFDSQIDAILKKIGPQLSLYPTDHIGVLFPKKEQCIIFEKALSSSPLIGSDRIWFDTLHGGKGWEFRAVHIGGCEALYRMGATQKRLTYTGILRAKTSVSLYYSGSIPGYLDSAVAVLSPPPDDTELSDLF
ncbi:AAA domain-containing protein [Acidovorax sp. 93]|uniref:AAA family ATPase n=1 Tax=Acidovorax sp. 93 TaxID=2135632 RepID=UPI000EB60925|nr:AAA family ATPase [Acidovorax sp. 93]RKR25685.1 AAA domain-containing protein [Acidovorax sp. 93]